MNHLQLTESLKHLRLQTFANELQNLTMQAETKRLSYGQFLAELVQAEISYRAAQRKKTLLAQSKVNSNKDLCDYNYTLREGISEKQITRLSQGEWLKTGTNLVLYGDIGVGKTHLAAGLIKKLCELNYRCYYSTTAKLIEDLSKAKRDLDLAGYMKRLDKFDLLVCDELGYSPQNQEGGDLFFQLIAHRYERKSILITTNLPYSEWQKVFYNPVTTAAAVDRIIHHCETINIMGPSGRTTHAKEKMQEKLTSEP